MVFTQPSGFFLYGGAVRGIILFMLSFSTRIKEKAFELGFSNIGIVPADVLSDEGEQFFRWLARGYHGEMAWITREPEKRSDPKLIFPEAKSVIVVAMNYYTPHRHADSPTLGKVSRYA